MNIHNRLDIDFVRSQFPGLDNGWTYFDNAGGSQILRGVVDRIAEYLYTKNVQIGGTYATSLEAAAALLEGRTAMASFINASRPEEIVFASSSTVAVKNLAKSMLGWLEPGDEVIVTNSDHETNIGPWVDLEKRGIVVKFWNLNADSLQLDLEDLDDLMSDRTKLVAVTHVSNILGTVNPIAEIARFVHERKALICVDSVAYAPHRLIDVKSLDVDFLFFSTYKTFGPHFAVFYGKYDLLAELDNIYHFFHEKSEVPRKLEPGNPSYELAFGLTGITDYFTMLGQSVDGKNDGRSLLVSAFAAISDYEVLLAERLLEYLRSRKDCRIIGIEDGSNRRRVPTLSFVIDGKDPAEIASSVEKDKIAIRYGDFYARRLIDYLGYGNKNGVVRVSMVHYNTLTEVDSLILALERELLD